MNINSNLSLMLVSLVTILSNFLPVLMTNIPYKLQQTYPSYIICTTTSMTILSLMIATLLGSILLIGKWPHLPSDPRTISGVMYYLLNSSFYDSGFANDTQSRAELGRNRHESPSTTATDGPHQSTHLLSSTIPGAFAGLGDLTRSERDKRIIDLNYRYSYGEVLPTSARPKIQGGQSTSDSDTVPTPKNSTNTPREMGIYIEKNHTST